MEKEEQCEAIVRGDNRSDGAIISLAMCGLCDTFKVIGQLESLGLSREQALQQFRNEYCSIPEEDSDPQ